VFEEDVIGNLRTTVSMAPQYCTGCGDFHISWVLRRFGPPIDPNEWNGFREGIARGIAAARAEGRRPAILITGAADTGILKCVAEAAHLAGGEAAVKEIEVTLADHCETPLKMCRDYAARYGIHLDAVRTDIKALAIGQKFDVIAMHEVLPFFPADQRLGYLSGVVGKLRPDGLLVSWSLVGSHPQDVADKQAKAQKRLEALDAFFAGEGKDLTANAADLRARVQRGSTAKPAVRPFQQAGDVAAFHKKAGLAIVEELVLDRHANMPGPKRVCVVIVATPAG
jgi:hypothetical protein